MNMIEGISVHSAINWCFTSSNANYITIVNSVFADCLKYGVFPFKTNNIYFRNNIIIGVRQNKNAKNNLGKVYEETSGFEFYKNARGIRYEISNNVVSGVDGIGFSASGDYCYDKMKYPFWGNEVGSSMLGWLPTKNNSAGNCIRFSGIKVS